MEISGPRGAGRDDRWTSPCSPQVCRDRPRSPSRPPGAGRLPRWSGAGHPRRRRRPGRPRRRGGHRARRGGRPVPPRDRLAARGVHRFSPPRIYAGAPVLRPRPGPTTTTSPTSSRWTATRPRPGGCASRGSRGRSSASSATGRSTATSAPTADGLAALEASVPGGFSAGPGTGPRRRDAPTRATPPSRAMVGPGGHPHPRVHVRRTGDRGGNRRQVGWRTTDWAGDVQPRGLDPRAGREP